MVTVLQKACWAILICSVILQIPVGSAQTKLAREPIYSLTIIAKDSNVEAVIASLAKTADESKFAIRVDRFGPEMKSILVQLWRSDINAIVDNTPSRLNEYSLSLYNTDRDNPVTKDVLQAVAELLKRELSKINEVRLVEEHLEPY
jgi:hypothetical protein